MVRGGSVPWLVVAMLGLAVPRYAWAEGGSGGREATQATEAVVLPTRVDGEVADEDEGTVSKARGLLDALLTDTAQDLGLQVDVSDSEGSEAVPDSGLQRLADAKRRLVVQPVLRVGRQTELVLLLAVPGRSVLLTRVEVIEGRDPSVRAVVMLRDLVRGLAATPAAAPRRAPEQAPLARPRARSRGRIVLATNATVYGGFLGYSLQRASQSDDPRLLYPMLAVGAGVGLGAAVIVSDEWDVGVGDAWYLSAGVWWPAVAGHLVYQGRFADRPGAGGDEPWSIGLVASTTGLALSTVGLLSGGMGDGGAALAHSGGGLGLVIGGLAELAASGVKDEIPFGGMGYGAMGGWLVAASAAILLKVDPARILAIDLGVALGGLAGASAASPLLFGEPDRTKTRGWVAAAGGGMLVGGAVAWWWSRPSPKGSRQGWQWTLPSIGPVGDGVGVTWRGTIW